MQRDSEAARAVDTDREPDGHITVEGKPMAYWLPDDDEAEADEWPEAGDDEDQDEDGGHTDAEH